MAYALCKLHFQLSMIVTVYGKLVGLVEMTKQFPLMKNISSEVSHALAEIQVFYFMIAMCGVYMCVACMNMCV